MGVQTQLTEELISATGAILRSLVSAHEGAAVALRPNEYMGALETYEALADAYLTQQDEIALHMDAAFAPSRAAASSLVTPGEEN